MGYRPGKGRLNTATKRKGEIQWPVGRLGLQLSGQYATVGAMECHIYVRLLSLFVLLITTPTPAFSTQRQSIRTKKFRYETLRRLLGGHRPGEGRL